MKNKRGTACSLWASLPLSCRNIPLAVIVSVITVIVGYMLTNVSYYTVLGTQDVLASPAVAVVSRHPY